MAKKTGGAGADTLTGVVGDDLIQGLGGSDVLYGGQASTDRDVLEGGEGDDRLSAGLSDLGVVDGGSGTDTLFVTSSGTGNLSGLTISSVERIEIQAPHARVLLSATQFGAGKLAANAIVDGYTVTNGAGALLEIDGSGVTRLDFSKLRFSNWSGVDGVSIWGGDTNDTIKGTSGRDNLYGGDGNDLIVMGSASALAPIGDAAFGGAGNDVISMSAAGGLLYGKAYGNEGVDTFKAVATSTQHVADLTATVFWDFEALTLDGRASSQGIEAHFLSTQFGAGFLSNALIRGSGAESSETLTVRADYGLGGALDLSGLRFASWTSSGDHADHVKIFGSAGRDTITGTSQADVIDGGTDADVMIGGKGDDVYYVDSSRDLAREQLVGGGHDTVFASVDYNMYGAAPYVEDLVLMEGRAARNGYGNDLANRIQGNSADNSINGHGGADTMIGGGGNDTYYVDDMGDRVIETVTGGHDVVIAYADYTLRNVNVEELRASPYSAANGFKLTGNAQDNIIGGGALADVLRGVAGNDVIEGGGGNDKISGGIGTDTLTGGEGRDAFIFDAPLGEVDTITDFSHADDTIYLSQKIFTAFCPGKISSAEAADHLFYANASGALFYDADGAAGPGARVQFAALTPGLANTIDFSDFVVF